MSASPSAAPVEARGLEGVIALHTKICDIDGQKGELIYRGYDIDDLARNCTFEDVAWLLWKGELPTAAETDRLNRQLIGERPLPPMVLELLDLLRDLLLRPILQRRLLSFLRDLLRIRHRLLLLRQKMNYRLRYLESFVDHFHLEAHRPQLKLKQENLVKYIEESA